MSYEDLVEEDAFLVLMGRPISTTQYYYIILDWLQGRSGALEQAPESRIRGPLTVYYYITR